MKEFQGRRLFRQVLYSRPVLILLGLIIVLIGFSVFKLYRKEHVADLERQALLSELTRLEARRVELESEIERLLTERGQEAEIREKLGLALPGEGVITVIGPEAGSEIKVLENKSWWQKVGDFFAGLVQW